MTATFDEVARVAFADKINIKDCRDRRVKDAKIEPIDKATARGYIATYHYSKTFPDSTLYCYGAYFDNVLMGVICYGMGCGKNQYTAVIPDIQNGEYIELTRLWVSDYAPKNLESYFISHSIKLLPPSIKLIISFSDEKQGHCGIIYQASNFYYLGKNKGGKMLEMDGGIEKHPRLLGIYRMRHAEYREENNAELLKKLNMRYVSGGVKHRYVYLRGKDRKKMYEQIKDRIEPYPKMDVKKPDMEIHRDNQFTIFDFI